MLIDFVNLVNSKPHPIWYESERGFVIPVRNESERDRIVHNIGHGDQYGRGEAQNADAR